MYWQGVLFIITEHVLMLIKLLLAYLIPDSPRWVRDAAARQEFLKANGKTRRKRAKTEADAKTEAGGEQAYLERMAREVRESIAQEEALLRTINKEDAI